MVGGIGGQQFMSIGSDARFRQMQNSQKLLTMLGNPTAMSPEQSQATEKNIMLQKVTDDTLSKCSDVAYESAEKAKKAKIERGFKYLA